MAADDPTRAGGAGDAPPPDANKSRDELGDETQDESNEDFQYALQRLLEAYRPLLEQELQRASSPEALVKEARERPPSCEDEVALATRLVEQFFTDEVATRLLPQQARELLGPAERWRWCLRHIRCCIIFGWLICRGPRTFRAFAYYLHRYWRCVREALGTPLGATLSDADRADFRALVNALAGAYRPYLTDQLASVEFPDGVPDEVIAGRIDCEEGEDEAAAIFERLLTVDVAPALLGRAAFETHQKEPWFWFCRCWCLCAIRFGCCLARAKSLLDVLRCLRFYRRCLRGCFRPLVCDITAPTGCVPEEVNVTPPALVVPVKGTAAGGAFHHYTLEWSSDGGITFHATSFLYPPIPPGTATQGNSPVTGGLLALFDTTLLNPGPYVLRLTVFSTTGATCVATRVFSLFKQEVRILGFDAYTTMDTVWSDPAAKLIETVPALCSRPASPSSEVSFAECVSVWGGAFVGGCDDRKIKRYLLDYKPGFEIDCNTGGWTNFWSVDFTTPAQYRDINMRKDVSVLTAVWGPDCLVPVPFPPYCLLNDPQALLYPSCWSTHSSTCGLSGLYTVRLTVEDTDGNIYCDTQRIWIDNKPICADIQIDAVPKCADLFVSAFANPPECSQPWKLPISGIAYDEYIDETLPLTRPNDNFDYYTVTVAKQGGAEIYIPIQGPTPTPPPPGGCFHGTQRVGDPGTRCTPCDPAHPAPTAVFGTLAVFDLRAVDPLCSGSVGYTIPSDFTIERGTCCVYTFKVRVYDRTIFPGGPHYAEATWPVKICNDLK